MQDPLTDLHQYSKTFSIAQVLVFCERKGIKITRAMVQNYIRDGILPPPVGKRLYTHHHIAALVLIDRLKTVFDMPTIREALLPYMDEEGMPLDSYTDTVAKLNDMVAKWQTNIAPALAAEGDGGLLIGMMFAAELKEAVVR